MAVNTIRPAYSKWPDYNRALRERVAILTDEQLAMHPGPGRWPLWATVGHAACQRVFWLCDAAGEPGAETTPFPNAGYDCPGDDDLEHVFSATALVEALDSTFRIVERCLDSWMLAMLGEEVRHPEWNSSWALHPRRDHPAGLQPRRRAHRRAQRGVWQRRRAAGQPLGLRPVTSLRTVPELPSARGGQRQ